MSSRFVSIKIEKSLKDRIELFKSNSECRSVGCVIDKLFSYAPVTMFSDDEARYIHSRFIGLLEYTVNLVKEFQSKGYVADVIFDQRHGYFMFRLRK